MNKINYLNDEQIEAIQEIEDLLIDLAYANEDFYCSECLDTMRKLFGILTMLTGDTHDELYKEVCSILGRDVI